MVDVECLLDNVFDENGSWKNTSAANKVSFNCCRSGGIQVSLKMTIYSFKLD